MRFILVLSVVLGLSGISDARTLEGLNTSIGLLKKGEFYLRGCSGVGNSYINQHRPHLVVSRDGYVFVAVTSNDTIYCFDSDHNLVRKMGGVGLKMGQFPYGCHSITVSDNSEIIATDVRRRINVYDGTGSVLRSIFVPDFGLSPSLARKYRDYLIISGLHWDGHARVVVYEYESGRKVCEFFPVQPDEWEFLMAKNADGLFDGPLFAVSGMGHVFCNRMFDHRIFEYTLSGELVHIFEEKPHHYVGLSEVEACPPTQESADSEKTGPVWEATWSYSGCPDLYGKDILVVPRRIAPPYYLDMYSISEKRYLGYCELGKRPFVFSDAKYIYLYEHFSDSLLVVGKYIPVLREIQTPQPSESAGTCSLSKAASERLLLDVPAQSLKISADSINELKIVGLDGKERLLSDYLTNVGRHFVIFVRPFFDCPFLPMYEAVKEFCNKRPDYDLYVVISHPYKDELEFLLGGLELDGRVIPNLRLSDMKEIIPSYPLPGIVVLNGDGSKVLGRYSIFDLYGEANPKTLEQFFEDLTRADTSE